MSEEKKEEVKKSEDNEHDKKAEDKKDEEPQEIVLKVDMHCEACARKVVRALKGFQGVEEVKADYRASKVVVKGQEADPVKVSERIQRKIRRKVQIISPLPKPPEEKKEEPPKEEKKDEPPAPAVITVVLKVGMHCEPCAQVLQKKIRKIKGVDSVATDVANDQVIVKGMLNPDKLANDVYKRTGKQVSVVKDAEKKDEEVKKDDEKKQEEEAASKEEEGDNVKTDVKKSDYWPPKYYMDYTYPPQMFSDEDPNAYSVM